MKDLWIRDCTLPESTVAKIAAETPAPDWPHWIRYDNDCEQKRTTRELWRLGDTTLRTFAWLAGWEWIDELSHLTGVSGLLPDPTLHGGGIHVSGPGDRLGTHLDYALHPRLALERRVNVILFLTPTWRREWGGLLQFWDDEAVRVVDEIEPAPGRAVIWLNSDAAYHSVSTVAPGAPPRITAAAYYLTAPRPTATRKRALFVPNRGEP